MVLGAVAAMSLLSGDTGQPSSHETATATETTIIDLGSKCAGSEIVVGGLEPGQYLRTCIEFTTKDQEGKLAYPTHTPPGKIIP